MKDGKREIERERRKQIKDGESETDKPTDTQTKAERIGESKNETKTGYFFFFFFLGGGWGGGGEEERHCLRSS